MVLTRSAAGSCAASCESCLKRKLDAKCFPVSARSQIVVRRLVATALRRASPRGDYHRDSSSAPLLRLGFSLLQSSANILRARFQILLFCSSAEDFKTVSQTLRLCFRVEGRPVVFVVRRYPSPKPSLTPRLAEFLRRASCAVCSDRWVDCAPPAARFARATRCPAFSCPGER